MKFDQPDKCDTLKAADANQYVLTFLSQRRSGLVRSMTTPGPDAEQLALILRLAARVPDHRKLFPWRFLLFEGGARTRFGEHLARLFQESYPDMPPNRLKNRIEHERTRFERAPLIVGVVSSPKDCPRGTPKWEQELSAGAVCMTMLLAARASGFAAQWLTEWYAYDARINKILDLAESERMAGFIYMGTATENPTERPRPNLNEIIKHWQA